MIVMSQPQPDPGAAEARSAIDPATDPAHWAPVEAQGPRCPWCSTALETLEDANCPNCGAQLLGDADPGLPGLTVVAPPGRPTPLEPVKRNRLFAWISGEVLDDPEPAGGRDAAPEALAPPNRDVRREILRIQLEAAGIQLPPELPPEAPTTAAAPAAAETALDEPPPAAITAPTEDQSTAA